MSVFFCYVCNTIFEISNTQIAMRIIMKQIVMMSWQIAATTAVCLFFMQAAGAQTLSEDMHLDQVVVTGTRVPVLQESLATPVTVVGRETIEQSGNNALLPVLSQEVPGLFVNSRGILGYGVSGGAAGNISMRGVTGADGRVLMLIDGHPQYAPIYGHPIADAYIAGDAERVEVSRGASSVLYGSNAMGGAINIITRRPQEDGNQAHLRAMAGSYGSQLQTGSSDRIRWRQLHAHGRPPAEFGVRIAQRHGQGRIRTFRHMARFLACQPGQVLR